MPLDAENHLRMPPDVQRPQFSWQRVLIPVAFLSVALVWSTSAVASCGNYLYRNGKPVSDAFSSMNDHNQVSARESESAEVPSRIPRPPCHGPNCSGSPIPLMPVPSAPSNLIRGFDQAAIIKSLAQTPTQRRAIEIPESERGACFVPSSIFRPPTV